MLDWHLLFLKFLACFTAVWLVFLIVHHFILPIETENDLPEPTPTATNTPMLTPTPEYCEFFEEYKPKDHVFTFKAGEVE